MVETTLNTLEIAEQIAKTWERRRAFVEQTAAPVREWLVAALAPAGGDTLLELAAGVGDTGYDALASAGPDARLICTDFSPSMLEAARRRGAERKVENVEYRVVDAHEIDLPDGAVDGVICRFGYMLMEDPGRALAETRRVLRPGGQLVLAVWGPPERNPAFAIAGASLVRRGHVPPPDPAAPGVFRLGAAERVRGLLEAAGFSEPRIEEVPVRFAVASIDEYLAVTSDTAGPLALALRTLDASERLSLAAEIEEAFAPHATGAGYALPGVAIAAAAAA